ncbi:hypothetical protein C0Q70_04979 [Pomacea canaliculata]|uniref:Uncharacterized protein n=1 Tax=Pomacea canaliculata TaxID=400727 RepID=A0A2T7PJW0_POMCA|nr:hypothetical protein C0Q70_04979 [Pomacea canaliculata]
MNSFVSAGKQLKPQKAAPATGEKKRAIHHLTGFIETIAEGLSLEEVLPLSAVLINDINRFVAAGKQLKPQKAAPATGGKKEPFTISLGFIETIGEGTMLEEVLPLTKGKKRLHEEQPNHQKGAPSTVGKRIAIQHLAGFIQTVAESLTLEEVLPLSAILINDMNSFVSAGKQLKPQKAAPATGGKKEPFTISLATEPSKGGSIHRRKKIAIQHLAGFIQTVAESLTLEEVLPLSAILINDMNSFVSAGKQLKPQKAAPATGGKKEPFTISLATETSKGGSRHRRKKRAIHHLTGFIETIAEGLSLEEVLPLSAVLINDINRFVAAGKQLKPQKAAPATGGKKEPFTISLGSSKL